jgi:predicted hydrocarbon binding protein
VKTVRFSPRIMNRFVEMLSLEIGRETYHSVLSKSGLSHDWRSPEFFLALDNSQAAEAYARLQSALRTYYGRGARGILMRIGTKLWEPILNDAPLRAKAQAALVRRLPKSLKRKPALELLAGILGAGRGDITVHTLDLDLLLVDKASPTTLEQTDDTPVCFVTFGLIRECLYWATGEEHDIEERACRAMGAHQCEFKITIGA